jgi:transposase InsO family protein
VSHANARLNGFGRRTLVERVLAGHKPGEVAKQLNVSRATVYKWMRRFRSEGIAGLADRSSRPHRSPRQIPAELAEQIVARRLQEHVGARELSVLLGVPASTIGAVLRRAGVPHLANIDRLTGELVRGRRHSDIRYEHHRPGSLIHIDVKKLGKIPPGGGWRVHGRREEVRGRGLGWDYVHVAVDDHSRLAYAEVLPDERAGTCAEFLHRACLWFHDQHGVTVRRVLTDNAKSYRIGADWAAVCSALQIKRRFTKPGCPWTNGKAERFNRTLQNRWAYRTSWTSNADRTAALAHFLNFYNTVRGHDSLAGNTPLSRLAA